MLLSVRPERPAINADIYKMNTSEAVAAVSSDIILTWDWQDCQHSQTIPSLASGDFSLGVQTRPETSKATKELMILPDISCVFPSQLTHCSIVWLSLYRSALLWTCRVVFFSNWKIIQSNRRPLGWQNCGFIPGVN